MHQQGEDFFFLRYDVYTSPRVNTVSPEEVLGPLTSELKLSEVEFGRAALYIDNAARGPVLTPRKVGPWPEWMMALLTSQFCLLPYSYPAVSALSQPDPSVVVSEIYH